MSDSEVFTAQETYSFQMFVINLVLKLCDDQNNSKRVLLLLQIPSDLKKAKSPTKQKYTWGVFYEF